MASGQRRATSSAHSSAVLAHLGPEGAGSGFGILPVAIVSTEEKGIRTSHLPSNLLPGLFDPTETPVQTVEAGIPSISIARCSFSWLYLLLSMSATAALNTRQKHVVRG